MSDTRNIHVTYHEGGNWLPIPVHSLLMPNGARWDAVNGWGGHQLIRNDLVVYVEANQSVGYDEYFALRHRQDFDDYKRAMLARSVGDEMLKHMKLTETSDAGLGRKLYRAQATVIRQ